jgi:sialate O-acetylesterase
MKADFRPGIAGLVLLLATVPLAAEVKLPAILSDHVVLQRDKVLPIWGWADPGEQVSVSLGKKRMTTTGGPDGRWIVRLPAQPVSTEPLTLTVAGKTNTLTVADVLLGDVWMCCGQSNMEMVLGGCDSAEDRKTADFPLIRHLFVPRNFADAPASDVQGSWRVCTPESSAGFSGVGFYFARKVQAETGVPIGLLNNAVGATNIEWWISAETLLGTAELAPYAKKMGEAVAQYQKQLTEQLPAAEKWALSARAALGAGKQLPAPPLLPDPPYKKLQCALLHNGHIAPLIPMALRGVLWYQGESNADGNLYLEKTRAMVTDWREFFAEPNLPFYFVQLAAFTKPNSNAVDAGSWGAIRDVQRRSLIIPHTGMASAVDIGDADDIHPKNKADVGERLALWALANEYGKKGLVVSGPLFRELRVEGGKVRIGFDSLGGGLMAARKSGRAPAVEDKGGKLNRFAVCGSDKKWFHAEALIDGDTVVVSSPEVSAPVAVRYADATNPEGANLYNRAGLPASPFRSDDW